MSENFELAPDFHYYFPMHTLWDQATGEAAVATLKQEDRTMMMLFTDEDLAEKFIAVRPRAGVLVIAILHPKSLIEFAEVAKAKKGATHVAIDVSFIQTKDGLKSNRHPVAAIDFFIDSVRRDWQSQGEQANP